ncbi:MAG TPA: metalloregulator ArsR/SmtB family transcription factor [Acidobacteriaceae bacterium]|nr:metalloregulator ArsR/SmtB family transcription factor [Acidobacteriaceae bacterium]
MSEAKGAALRRRKAQVFAALGDETRLALVAKLCRGEAMSISELTESAAGAKMTRQAVTKHLRVLERAGLVRCSQLGRERRFAFRPEPVMELREYLAFVSAKWDEALERLRAFVEE